MPWREIFAQDSQWDIRYYTSQGEWGDTPLLRQKKLLYTSLRPDPVIDATPLWLCIPDRVAEQNIIFTKVELSREIAGIDPDRDQQIAFWLHSSLVADGYEFPHFLFIHLGDLDICYWGISFGQKQRWQRNYIDLRVFSSQYLMIPAERLRSVKKLKITIFPSQRGIRAIHNGIDRQDYTPLTLQIGPFVIGSQQMEQDLQKSLQDSLRSIPELTSNGIFAIPRYDLPPAVPEPPFLLPHIHMIRQSSQRRLWQSEREIFIYRPHLDFAKDDVSDWQGFLQQFKGDDRVSLYIRNKLSQDTKARLDQYGDESTPEDLAILQALLVRDCNQQILSDESLYDEQRFEDVILREATKRLLQKPTTIATPRLNRLLLEDVYKQWLPLRELLVGVNPPAIPYDVFINVYFRFSDEFDGGDHEAVVQKTCAIRDAITRHFAENYLHIAGSKAFLAITQDITDKDKFHEAWGIPFLRMKVSTWQDTGVREYHARLAIFDWQVEYLSK